MAISRLAIFKFVELGIALVCVGLHYDTIAESEPETKLITAGTFVGFSIIFLALFAGYVMGTPVNKRLDLYFTILGCALFIASGALIIKEWENGWKTDKRTKALAKGSIAIFNGAVLLIDMVFTFKD